MIMSLYSVGPATGPAGWPAEYCTNWPTFSSRVILRRRTSIFCSTAGSIGFDESGAVSDAAPAAGTWAVADCPDRNKDATIAIRIIGVSTFLDTPFAPMKARTGVFFSAESINTLLDSGTLG